MEFLDFLNTPAGLIIISAVAIWIVHKVSDQSLAEIGRHLIDGATAMFRNKPVAGLDFYSEIIFAAVGIYLVTSNPIPEVVAKSTGVDESLHNTVIGLTLMFLLFVALLSSVAICAYVEKNSRR